MGTDEGEMFVFIPVPFAHWEELLDLMGLRFPSTSSPTFKLVIGIAVVLLVILVPTAIILGVKYHHDLESKL